jgi:A/G-specific adenine glycosylase
VSAEVPATGSGLAALVIAWQCRHGRHGLPWQRTRDPYRVWLSEVMLQQTQVGTVLDYYPRFLARFPDVHALAAAPLDDVLALWSGLGYYSRARNLHRCAQTVVAAFGGRFPTDSASLARLPGIGRSTAAAIAAFCFGERAAILDGNVKRVMTRVLGFADDLTDARAQRTLWGHAESLLPEDGIEAYTQGLMDLGATVCTARSPRCDICPLAAACVARAEGRPQHYPVKSRRRERGQRVHAVLWLWQGCRLWLVKRPATGVWASLWSLPEFDSSQALTAVTARWPGAGAWLPPIRHALTHFDWELHPWQHRLPSRLGLQERQPIERDLGSGRWFSRDEALRSGLPAPIRRLIEQQP